MSDDTTLDALARKHGFGIEAVLAAADALTRGTGGTAQFDHPKLGGMGQWMPGMTMIGRMGDTALKARVDALFADLTRSPKAAIHGAAAGTPQGPLASASWWPSALGAVPAQTGGQNHARYAYFPATARLAIEEAAGAVTVYDTTGYELLGADQQQSSGAAGALTFQTARGPVTVAAFRRLL